MKTTKPKTSKINNFFDKGLFLEATRQLKILGIVSVVLSAAASIIIPLYVLIMILYNGSMIVMISGDLPFEFFKECKNLISYHHIYQGFITLILLVYVPIACLMLFNFLTKRNACDYFHSFPQKRGCIFTTYVLAILSWGYAIVGVYAVSSVAIYAIFTYFFDTSLLYILQNALYLFMATTLGTTTICLACTLTGTVFTNVIISGILLFLPRLFITSIGAFLTSTSEVFVASHFTFWSEFGTNLIFSYVARIFTDIVAIFTGKIELPSLIAFVYTAILSLAYFIAGRWFFIRRHSEAAGKPADNVFTRFILRICTGMPFALIAILLALDNIYFNSDGLDPVTFFFIIVLEIVGMATIFIYEMISTKSFNVLLRVLPSLPVFIIIQACIVLISCGFERYESSFRPDGKDIDYVTIKSFDDEPDIYNDVDFFENKMLEYKYSNDEIKEFISTVLKDNIDDDNLDEKANSYDYNSVVLAINSGLSDKYRAIYLNEEQYNQFMSLVFKEEGFAEYYLSLPAFNSNNIYLYDESLYEAKDLYTDYSGYKRVYNTLLDELKTVDPVKYAELVSRRYTPFSIEGSINSNDLFLPITAYTPKTLLEYMNTANASTTNSPSVIGAFQSSIALYLADNTPHGDPYYDYYEKNSIELLIYNEDYTDSQYSLSNYIYTYDVSNHKKYLTYFSDALDQIRTSCKEQITDLNKEGYVLVEYSTYYGDNFYKGYGYVEKDLIHKLESLVSY